MFKKQLNTSELGIVHVVTKENENCMEMKLNFYCDTSSTQEPFQAVVKMVNRLRTILCAKTALNKEN